MKSKLQVTPKIQLKKSFAIESARFLPNLPKTHPCSQTHGHSFKITLTLQGAVDLSLGWLIDYNTITRLATPILKQIDHKLLNKVADLKNPTTENLTIWLYDNLKVKLPDLLQITVKETDDTECSYPII